jgi:hypothetical protein
MAVSHHLVLIEFGEGFSLSALKTLFHIPRPIPMLSVSIGYS